MFETRHSVSIASFGLGSLLFFLPHASPPLPRYLIELKVHMFFELQDQDIRISAMEYRHDVSYLWKVMERGVSGGAVGGLIKSGNYFVIIFFVVASVDLLVKKRINRFTFTACTYTYVYMRWVPGGQRGAR